MLTPTTLETRADMTQVFIHSTAIVECDRIGEGTRIWAFTHVMRDVSIGADCNIGEHCFIESGAVVGNQVTIKNGNLVWDGIHLEDGVFVGPQVVFTNDLYPRSPRLAQARKRYADHGWLKPTRIRQGASLGAGAVILAGITIGDFCMVAAGSTVTRSLPPYALAVGSPARIRGWVCQCGKPLDFAKDTAICAECGLEFVNAGGSVELLRPVVSAIPEQSAEA
jgi:UDP-2-acetamido-3-amino-2,3-dideoxy-glucuronate N-acetyltransferase